ncbi:MAG: C45 family peptidase [Candidatus Saccharibacteria bacterium]|nr:C45 family peptidase [Candidatus Saccharibacteria bacterium]
MNKFTGSYTEFGEYLAKKLAERNHDFNTQVNKRTLNKQLKIYKKYWPEILEESKAVANYLNMPEDEILYDEIASTIDSQKRHVKNAHDSKTDACTIFAINENSKTFVGRNYDWDSSARNYFQTYNLKIGKSYRYFAFSDEGTYPRHYGRRTWKLYMEDAINEHGLYIGLTASKLREKYWSYGFSSYHIIRYIAEHCKTAKEAIAAFRKIPVAVPKNFLIADKTGDITVIEHAAKSYKILRPKKLLGVDYIIHTNHCLSPEYAKVDPVLRCNPSADTFLRYAEADYLIRTQLPNYDFTDTSRILRNSHYVYNEDTIWSLALELSEPRLTYYYDTAEGQKEVKFSFAD